MEVLVAQPRRTLSQRNHTSLDANRFELRTVELVRTSREFLKVDVLGDGHLAAVDLENRRARGLVG